MIKADSEGRVGPSKYGRTPAQAANTVARALKPHGGVVLYRGFVYNNHLDWNDPKADRARAGYDNFHALDGKFDHNVVIQIKHGPIDFQVREPVSPLFAALRHTNQAIELQITQEYTGQQRHMVFLVPMWKVALDTDMRAQNRSTLVSEIVAGKSFHQPLGGFVGVANVGLDANWLHHPMAMANLYGFGKLAWNPDLTTDGDHRLLDPAYLRQRSQGRVYRQRTAGGFLAGVRAIHRSAWAWGRSPIFSASIMVLASSPLSAMAGGNGSAPTAKASAWTARWLRAPAISANIRRELAKIYESVDSCPDSLLLFMHHVPYDHMLQEGKTVVQHVYDAHYDGAATAATYPRRWRNLHGLIDDQRYYETLALFEYEAGHAVVWRDAVTAWFQHISGIPDKLGRVGHYPDRIEAESMQSDGYSTVDVTPWETASAGKAVVCNRSAPCTLTTKPGRLAGSYSIAVQYFDLRTGAAQYELLLNGKSVAHWVADAALPPAAVDPQLDGSTSTRFTVSDVRLRPGDTLSLRGTPNQGEPAPVDYIEIQKQ